MGETLGFTESVSIALGGMIGGGIYAVLGVVEIVYFEREVTEREVDPFDVGQ